MALVIESVFRTKPTHTSDILGGQQANTGNGEAFADLLARTGSLNTDSRGLIQPQTPLPSAGPDPAAAARLGPALAPQTQAPPGSGAADFPAAATLTPETQAARSLAPGGSDTKAQPETPLPSAGPDPAAAARLGPALAPQTVSAATASLPGSENSGGTGQARKAAKPGSTTAPVATDIASLRDPQRPDTVLTATAAGPEPLTSADRSAVGDTSAQTGQSSLSLSGATYTPPAVPAAAPPVSIANGLTPAHSMIVAAPAQVVDIISSAADDGQSDSIVVQLDPPELGRVSIDFKFDANGLQHVTITGESSEAMRQLRLMHFELIQALERHGIASSNMTFQQQQNHQQSALPNPFAREPLKSQPGLSETGEARITSYSLPSARTLPGGRLDMKL